MSFLWEPATPILVQLSGSSPKAFVWQGRRHEVRWIANEWQVDFGWWRLRLWRDYYKILTRTGLLVLLYQDLQTGDWFLQQIYD